MAPSSTAPYLPSLDGAIVNGLQPHHDHATASLNAIPTSSSTARPTVLHLGAPICYNPSDYKRLALQFDIIRPEPEELPREIFMKHLSDRTWGDFSAIMKPFWSTGSEMHPWDRELIDLLPSSMKIMAGAGAGFDWVDTQALTDRGIIYANGANASTESVGNTALYHLISVFTHATHSSLAARSLSPPVFRAAHTDIPFISHNPAGHTLGIVGLGLIGFVVAKKAKDALGMKIIYHDLQRKPRLQEKELDARFFPCLDDMLPHCDCILLAAPSGPPMLTRRTLALLPRGARVVNVARGSLIDEEALADALDEGHIGAAGLDVHRSEPDVNERFVGNWQVQLTCHTGGASVETNAGFELLVLQNVEEVLSGRGSVTGVNEHLLGRRRGQGGGEGMDGVGVGREVNGHHHDRDDEHSDDDRRLEQRDGHDTSRMEGVEASSSDPTPPAQPQVNGYHHNDNDHHPPQD